MRKCWAVAVLGQYFWRVYDIIWFAKRSPNPEGSWGGISSAKAGRKIHVFGVQQGAEPAVQINLQRVFFPRDTENGWDDYERCWELPVFSVVDIKVFDSGGVAGDDATGGNEIVHFWELDEWGCGVAFGVQVVNG